MLSKFALGVAYAVAMTTSVQAQPVEVLFQSVINGKGKDCTQVTAINPIAQSSSGSAIIAAACSNGSRHVVEIRPNLSLKYVSSCRTFEALSGKSCF